MSCAVLWNWKRKLRSCPYFDFLLIQILDYSSLLFQHTPATKAIYMWLINCPNFSSCFQGCYLFRSILSTVWLTWQHIMLRPPNETAIPSTLVPHYYMIRKMLRQKKSLDSITSSHTSKVIIVWLVHKIILMPFRWYPGQDIRWWYSWYCTKSL